MNPNLGNIVTAKMIDDNDDNYFVQIDGETYKLPKQEMDKELHILFMKMKIINSK